MNLNKIDRNLLVFAGTMTGGKKRECIVLAYDYNRTKDILLNKNITILNEYLFIKSFRVLIDNNELSYLSRVTQVKFISSLAHASALMDVAKRVIGSDKILHTGKGVSIAFVDTGINKHCDFMLGKNRIKFFKDFINDKKECYDDNGHGTFVAGVCSGSGALSGGRLSGIAPQSEIISLKTLDKYGEASADKILNAMSWLFDNHRQCNIKVVCMSFGSDPLGFNDPIMHGAEALWREGVTVVAAAGNSGPENQTIKSPGVSGQIITVGGFDDNRLEGGEINDKFFEIAPFSSRGPAFQKFKPDLVAPSVDIVSCGIKENYTSLSGTSVATPMIAGLCALMLEKEPTLLPTQIKSRLLRSCKPICFNRNFEGVGYPNARNLFSDR